MQFATVFEAQKIDNSRQFSPKHMWFARSNFLFNICLRFVKNAAKLTVS